MKGDLKGNITKIVILLLLGISLIRSSYMFSKLVYKKIYLDFVHAQYDSLFGIELDNFVGGEILFILALGAVYLLSRSVGFEFLEKIRLRAATGVLCLIILLTNFLSFVGIGEHYGLCEGAGIFALFYIFSFVFIALPLFNKNWLHAVSISVGIPLILFGSIIGSIADSGFFSFIFVVGAADIISGFSKWRLQSPLTEILRTIAITMTVSVSVPVVFFGGLILIGGCFYDGFCSHVC